MRNPLRKLKFWGNNHQEVNPEVQQEIDEYMSTRPYKPIQQGHVPASAGEKAVAGASAFVVLFFAGVFAVLFFVVFPFFT